MMTVTIGAFWQWILFGAVIGFAVVGVGALVMLLLWTAWTARGRYDRLERGGGGYGRH